MRRRSRTRRILKWVGLLGCVVTILSFVFSVRWEACWLRLDEPTLRLMLAHGTLYAELGYDTGDIHVSGGTRTTWWVTRARVFGSGIANVVWRPFIIRETWYLETPHHSVAVGVPLWLPFVALAIPTAFLWYRDRGHPRGRCQKCGYDLTGNESGTCPECGEAVKA